MQVQLRLGAADSRLSGDSTHFAARCARRNRPVAELAVVIEHAAIVTLTYRQDVHQPDPTAVVGLHPSVDHDLSGVQDPLGLAAGVGDAEDVAQNQCHGHAVLNGVTTGIGLLDPYRGLARKGPAAWHD